MIYIFLADGFEECEALVPLDILRRAELDVKTVGIGSKTITGSHGICITCDLDENQADYKNLEGIILPGGMPGTLNLEKNETVQKFIDYSAQNRLLISAICAAPMILGHKNLLKDRNATCFSGFEKDLLGAKVSEQPVVVDQNYITAFGAGAAFPFGFEILAYLKGKESAENMKKSMRYQI